MAQQYDEELCWPEEKLPQKERMKYTHTIHPYFGKFIPQLANHFLAGELKNASLVCDPFMGSGTTLIEANLRNIPSIGMDISKFNVMMCKIKTKKYNVRLLRKEVNSIFEQTNILLQKSTIDNYIQPKQKRKIFKKTPFLEKWFHPEALHILLVFKELIPNHSYQDVLKIILSRTARSSRLIAHFEVDYPKQPYPKDYYCFKHKRTCHPTKNAFSFLKRYCTNTVDKIEEFQEVRNDVYTEAIHGDSRVFNFSNIKISDVFTSPPYLGLIDYHEQHRYAYELLGIEDNSKKEIGAKMFGSGKSAVAEYKNGMISTIKNITENSFDRKNGKFIIVVHDKLGIYKGIIQDSGMKLVKNYFRRVERRSGRRAGIFTENVLVCKVANHGQ